MDVIYSHTCSYKWVLARSSRRHLQPIVLPSLMLKPANVTHLQIEEDMIYTSVHKAFGFDQSYSCSKGVFGRNGRQYSELHHTEFLNVKWRRHVLLPTLNEELAYKRGVARPNNMWLNLVKMAGRLSVAPSLSWLLSIFI